MKAILKTNPGIGVNLQEVPSPSPGPEDILVAVNAAGICGSDLSIALWKEGYRHMSLPLILGHEFTGKVVSKGSKVQGIDEGDRVIINPIIPCSQCPKCLRGFKYYCRCKELLGLTKNGCFADYISVPSRASFFKLPDTLSDKVGSLVEPFSVSYHAIEISNFRKEDRVGVLGMGPIGLMIAGLLKLLGASFIMIIGRSPKKERVDIAQGLGADRVLDIHREDPVKISKEITEGEGFDIIFEASGNPSSVSQGLEMIRTGGEVVLSGIFEGKGEIHLTEFVRGSKRLIGNHTYEDTTLKKVIHILSEKEIPAEKLITHELPLSEGLVGFDLLMKRQGVKIVLRP